MNKIQLKGTKNSRDFGSIASADGRVIKPHLFLRSDSLQNLTESDSEILCSVYSLSTVIDLRTVLEVEEKADVVPDGVNYCHLPLIDELMPGLTHEKAADKRVLLELVPDMTELYRKIVTDENSIAQLKKIFELILNHDENSSVLWHCTEGKDRCGIVSALFLSLLDVEREVIYSDYLDTNKNAYKKGVKMYLLVILLAHSKEKAKKVWNAFTANKKFLKAAFDEIEKTYGSVDTFFEQKLGITKEMKESFKNKVLK